MVEVSAGLEVLRCWNYLVNNRKNIGKERNVSIAENGMHSQAPCSDDDNKIDGVDGQSELENLVVPVTMSFKI